MGAESVDNIVECLSQQNEPGKLPFVAKELLCLQKELYSFTKNFDNSSSSPAQNLMVNPNSSAKISQNSHPNPVSYGNYGNYQFMNQNNQNNQSMPYGNVNNGLYVNPNANSNTNGNINGNTSKNGQSIGSIGRPPERKPSFNQNQTDLNGKTFPKHPIKYIQWKINKRV